MTEIAVQDVAVFLLLILATRLLIGRYQRLNLSYPSFFWVSLAVYHYLISGLAVFYVISDGGDSPAYWNLTADTSQGAVTWMEHWGYSTFFVQWLNYFPARILDISYWGGCMIYSFMGLIGAFIFAELAHPLYQKVKSNRRWLPRFFVLLFFLPSFHFWNGLVGKEALVWFLVCFSALHWHKGNFLVSFSIVISIAWTRPAVGILVLIFFMIQLVFSDRLSLTRRIGLGVISVVVFCLGFGLLLYITHLEGINWESIQHFREGQYAFLERFASATELPVRQMSLGEILFAVAFRPLPGEIGSIWGLSAGLENLILLVISFGMFGLFFKEKEQQKKMITQLALIGLVVTYFLIIASSVNVLGIMIRLKTIAMPFWIYFGFMGWYLIIQKMGIRNFARNHIS